MGKNNKFKKLDSINIELAPSVIQPTDGKYAIGSPLDNLYDIKHLKPTFAFDYVSESKDDFSLINHSKLCVKDYRDFFSGLKHISKQTYDELMKREDAHFHSVDWDDTAISARDFERHIDPNRSNTGEEITAYQVKLINKARLFGFLYKGVFYVVLFDRGYDVYKRK